MASVLEATSSACATYGSSRRTWHTCESTEWCCSTKISGACSTEINLDTRDQKYVGLWNHKSISSSSGATHPAYANRSEEMYRSLLERRYLWQHFLLFSLRGVPNPVQLELYTNVWEKINFPLCSFARTVACSSAIRAEHRHHNNCVYVFAS